MNLFLRRHILVLCILLGSTCGSYAQWQAVGAQKTNSLNVWVDQAGKSSTLVLIYRHDGKFMISDNKLALDYIKSLIDNNRKAIDGKDFKIWVDSYVSKDGMSGYLCRKEALSLSNIFKSHAITNWGLSEADFTTQNFSGTYDNEQGVTVVTLGENYPYEYIDARQSLNLSDLLSSEPSHSRSELEVERLVVEQTLDGREIGVVAQTEQASVAPEIADGGEVDAKDTAALSKLLVQIESRKANAVGDDNKFYTIDSDRKSGLGVDKPLPVDKNYELLYNSQKFRIGDSGSPALASSGMRSDSQSRYFTKNRFLIPMGMIPLNPYGLSIGGGGTLSASGMYGLNVPSLMSVREPISQRPKDDVVMPRVDDGRTPQASLFKIAPPSYNATLSAHPVAIGSTVKASDPISAGTPQVLTYKMSGPSIAQTAPVQIASPSLSADIDMSNMLFTPIGEKRIKKNKDERITGSKIKVGGKEMPSVEVGADGKIALSATSLGYALNKGTLAQEQRELRSYDAATQRAERELALQRKSESMKALIGDKGRFPILGVGVNALAALTTTVSGQLDFYFHNHMSFGIEGAYNNWNVFGDNYRTSIWMGSAEFRYWFGKSKQFTGFYLGAYGSMGDFNFRFGSTDGTQSSFYSVGLTAGYVLRLGRESNFYVDFGLGGGFVHESGVDYTYSNGYNLFKQSFIRTGFAPTKAKVTFMYRIFNKPKGGLY